MIYALYYGGGRKILAKAVPDIRWPEMWRLEWPDGEVSDIGNLSRIKDAGEVICQRRHPDLRSPKDFHWKAQT